MEDKKKEESNKYESFASFLDNRSATPGEDVSPSEEEMQKLVFLWDECNPPKADTGEVWNKTLRKIKEEDRKMFRVKKRSAFMLYGGLLAASVVLLFGMFYFLHNGGGEAEDEKAKMEQILLADNGCENAKEVTLVVSDKKKIEITNNAKVAYTQAGQVQVNSVKLDEAIAKEETKKEETEEYNQIIVPKGRRSMIVLADNSQIWINSGSRVVYPRTFKGDKRQIFVEGEAYLKVARNEAKPFVVNTSSFEVEVLGTSFNISARKDKVLADVVLVEGAVDVKDSHDRHVRMQPNERVELDEAGISKKETVNALDYIHWVDGVWVLSGKPLKQVLYYLTEYYGQAVTCDPSVEDIPFYGKLYLNEELEQVIESIRQALPLELASREEIVRKDGVE